MIAWTHQKGSGGKMRYYIIPFFIISFFLVNPQAYAENKDTASILENMVEEDIKMLTVINALKHCDFVKEAEELSSMFIETKIMSLSASGEDIETYKDLMMGFHSGFQTGYSVALSLEKTSEDPTHKELACRIASDMLSSAGEDLESKMQDIK